MRYIVLFLLPFLSIFLQSTFFSSFSIEDSIPDLVLVFVVFYALLYGEMKGCMYGFFCGLLEDLYMGRFIGTNAIAKGMTALVIGRLQGRFYRENLLVGMVSVFIGTIINAVIMVIFGLTAYKVFNVDISLLRSVFYQSLYNVMLSAPLYIWFYNSSSRGILSLIGERR